MNREILFKAKRVDNGEWVEGDLIQLLGKQGNGRKFIVNNSFGACIDEKGNFINTGNPFVNEVIPETVCQYTGLVDKNGKKIFTDDEFTILQNDYENGYENSWGNIMPDEIKVTKIMTFDFVYTYKLFGEFNEDSIEVIGSIHDKDIKRM